MENKTTLPSVDYFLPGLNNTLLTDITLVQTRREVDEVLYYYVHSNSSTIPTDSFDHL